MVPPLRPVQLQRLLHPASRYVFEPIAVETRRFQLLSSSSFKRAWQEDFCQLWRGKRGQLFIPVGLGVGAAS